MNSIPRLTFMGKSEKIGDQFKPLLRKVFSLAKDVRYDGLPPYSCLTKEDADSYMSACREMTERNKGKNQGTARFYGIECIGITTLDDFRN